MHRAFSTFLAAALFSVTAASALAQEAKPFRNITASGMAERHITPDEAHITITIAAINPKLEAAKTEHDGKLRDVLALLQKAGIEKAQIRTVSSSTQPQYTYENSKRLFKGYQMQTMLDITVRKIESVGELLEKLAGAKLENAATNEWANFLSVSYTLSNPNKLRDEMLTDAIKNARAKAENMATAAGTSLGRVVQISENGAPNFTFPPMPMMARGMAMRAQSAEMAIAPPPGEQLVSANVTVSFELKD